MGRRRSILEVVTDRAVSRVRTHLAEKSASRLSATPKHASVVLWPREPTHIQVQHPVGVALSEKDIDSAFVACQPAILGRLGALQTRATYTRRAWGVILRQARREGRRAARSLSTDPGISLPSFLDARGAGEAIRVLRRRIVPLLPLVHEAIASAEALIESMSPKALVVGNDLTFEGRSACLKARLSRLPTASVMHGTVSGDARHAYHLADLLLVYGANTRRKLLSLAIEPSRIVVCGAPQFDHIPRQTGKPHDDIGTRSTCRDGDPWVLVALSGPGQSISHSHHEVMIEHIMRLSAKLRGVRFVAKLHRKDRPEYYRHIRQRSAPGSTMEVVPYGSQKWPSDIFDWLQGCSAVLTGASAVAVEAMLMDVPVVTMDFAAELKRVAFIAAGATLHVQTAEQLEQAVQAVLDSSDRIFEVKQRVKTFLSGEFFALDNRSAVRCAEAIGELVGAS